MPLFKLNLSDGELSRAILEPAEKTSLDLETYLESWLENSPVALGEEPLLWIGRQPSASVEEKTVFPDLLGLDADGKVAIVELKRGRPPRDVVAQILEYAAWANDLTDEQIRDTAATYLSNKLQNPAPILEDVFSETFETDLTSLNTGLRLFIVAETIPPPLSRVCRFLRTAHGVDITCIAVSVHRTEAKDYLVNTEYIVGQEEAQPPKKKASIRWSGEKPVKEIVWEAVREVAGKDKNYVFSPKEITERIREQYPSFNKSTVGCQLIAACVNHKSRHHYPGGEDRYWWLEQGKYRIYDPDQDNLSDP